MTAVFALVHRSRPVPTTRAVCGSCNHTGHRTLKNPVMRLYERVKPPTTCQVWVDRTTFWDGELCRCPAPIHRC